MATVQHLSTRLTRHDFPVCQYGEFICGQMMAIASPAPSGWHPSGCFDPQAVSHGGGRKIRVVAQRHRQPVQRVQCISRRYLQGERLNRRQPGHNESLDAWRRPAFPGYYSFPVAQLGRCWRSGQFRFLSLRRGFLICFIHYQPYLNRFWRRHMPEPAFQRCCWWHCSSCTILYGSLLHPRLCHFPRQIIRDFHSLRRGSLSF